MATIRRTGDRVFSATFDESVLTNDNGYLLADLVITKWNGNLLLGSFLYSKYRFTFHIDDSLIKRIKTKLLIGIPVSITVHAHYAVW